MYFRVLSVTLACFSVLGGSPSLAIGASTTCRFVDGQLLKVEDVLRCAHLDRDVQLADSELRQAGAAVTRAYDPYLPDVALRGEHEFHNSRNGAYLNVDVNVFDKGRDINGIRIAKSNQRVIQFGRERRILAAQLTLVDLYYTAVFGSQQRKLLEGDLAFLKSIRAKVSKFFRHQVVSRRQNLHVTREITLAEQRLVAARFQEEQALQQLRTQLAFDVGGAQSKPKDLKLEELKNFKIEPKWTASFEELRGAAMKSSKSLAEINEAMSQYDAKKWLAYSDQLPRVGFNFRAGRLYDNGTPVHPDYEASIRVEIPLPIFDVPLMLPSINRELGETLKRQEISATTLRENLEADVAIRLTRLQQVEGQLVSSRAIMQILQEEREEEEKAVKMGALEGSDFVLAVQQSRDLALSNLNFLRLKSVDYVSLKLMTGGPWESWLRELRSEP
jgi:outer membrane protein TolC